MKFTFKSVSECGRTVEMDFDQEQLDDIRAMFNDFLRGSGFCFEDEQWDTSEMAHRSGGLSVEQTEKQEKLCKYCGGIGRVVCDGKCMPEQEPVAWIGDADFVEGQFVEGRARRVWWECNTGVGQPLYTAPPKREQDNPKLQLDAIERAYFHGKQQGIAESEAIKRLWVGLSEEERRYFASWLDYKTDDEVFNAIEAKLRERNT